MSDLRRTWLKPVDADKCTGNCQVREPHGGAVCGDGSGDVREGIGGRRFHAPPPPEIDISPSKIFFPTSKKSKRDDYPTRGIV